MPRRVARDRAGSAGDPPPGEGLAPFAAAGEAALLPAAVACFPERSGAEHAALHRALSEALAEFRRQAEINPYSNPIQLLALDVLRRIDAGELSYGAIEQLIERPTAIAFFGRAERLGRYLGERDPDANAAGIKAHLRRLAAGETGGALTVTRVTAPEETADHGRIPGV